MPNIVNKNFTTLSHLYNAPVPHHRDFVRENKENVTKSKKTKEKPPIADNYMPFSSSADRISSRSSGYDAAMRASAQVKKTRMRSPIKKQPWTYGREASDRKILQKVASSHMKAPPSPKPTKRVPIINTRDKGTNVTNKTKIKTSNMAVQTDEIHDEIYLYNALKKCASPAFKSALKTKYLQKERDSHSKQSANSVSQEILPLDDSRELQGGDYDAEKVPCELNRHEHAGGDNKPVSKHVPQRTESVQTDFNDFYMNPQRTDFKHRTPRDYCTQSQLNVMTMTAEGLSSCSPSKCMNCPVGYHLLSEEEREAIRAKLLNHENLLIKQLNSFPLAIETLRVRQSKTRIEKELTILEQNLRKLTKRKVYAKIHE